MIKNSYTFFSQDMDSTEMVSFEQYKAVLELLEVHAYVRFLLIEINLSYNSFPQ